MGVHLKSKLPLTPLQLIAGVEAWLALLCALVALYCAVTPGFVYHLPRIFIFALAIGVGLAMSGARFGRGAGRGVAIFSLAVLLLLLTLFLTLAFEAGMFASDPA